MRKVVLLLVLLLVLTPVAIYAEDVQEEDQSNVVAEYATTSKVIKGIEPLRWNKGRDCTFFGALTSCLISMGEQVSYEYLMGVSGAAFATRFHRDWSAASPDAALNDDHPKAALDAVGYTYDRISGSSPDAGSAVMSSIDAGRPVVASGFAGSDDWGLVVGYLRMGDTWSLRTYADRTGAYAEAAKLPKHLLVLGEKHREPDMADSIKRSIKLAVEFGKGQKKPGDLKYDVGFAAFETWIQSLQSANLSKLSGKHLEYYSQINAWIYGSLLDARSAAVTYLRWASQALPESKEPIDSAAALYQEEVDILREARECAPYPFQVTSGPKWASDMREKQVEVLRKALDKEKAAIALLEKVSSSSGPK